MSDEKPFFTHDCPSCVFLGCCMREPQTKYSPGGSMLYWYPQLDLYFCPKQVGGPTVIARYGSDGPDYCSGLPFAVEGEFGIPELLEAKKRAITKGLIK